MNWERQERPNCKCLWLKSIVIRPAARYIESMGKHSIRLALAACMMVLAGLVTGQANAKGVHPVGQNTPQSTGILANVANLLIHCPSTAVHSQDRHQHDDSDQHDDQDGKRSSTLCSAPASVGIPAATTGLPVALGLGQSVPWLVTSVRSLSIAPPRRPPRISS